MQSIHRFLFYKPKKDSIVLLIVEALEKNTRL